MKNKHFLNNIIIILLLSAYSITGYSQSIWYKTFGSWNESEQAKRVVQTFDGGYLVLTLQGSTGLGYYNIFKLNNSGNLLWRKLLADSSNKQVYEFQQTSDSGFIFTGRCTTAPWGGFLIKTDKNGNFKWQKNYTNLSYQTQFSTVKQTSDKGFITCGFYVDLINGGSKGVAVKTDSLGNVQWEKQYIDSLMNHYTDIMQDSIGSYYLTGNIYNMSDNLYTVIKKLNSSGNIIWTKIFGNKTGGEFLFEMKNEFIMSISVSAYNYNPGYIPIATKLDTAGNIKWSNNYPYSLMNLYACKDNFDNICFAGNVDTNNIGTIRIKKIDSSGVLLKNKLISFVGYNFISSQCIKTTTDLGFIISGSAAKLDTVLNPHSFSLVIKTDSAYNAPVIINKINSNPVSVLKDFTLYLNYPNPFNSITTIKFNLPNNGLVNICIFDVLGKIVFSKKKYYKSGLNEFTVDFNEYILSSSIYFFRVNFESFSKLLKVIYLK
jgi:hypothetical protein